MIRVTLWILEDDENLGFLLQTVLSAGSRDLAVNLFTTGEEALKSKGAPDILIADTHLEGKLTGLEVAEALRVRNPDLAVIYSSALGRPKHVVLGPRDRELPKPFSVAALLAQVITMITEVPRRQVPPHRPHLPGRHWKRR